jgi:hypothetical protein
MVFWTLAMTMESELVWYWLLKYEWGILSSSVKKK